VPVVQGVQRTIAERHDGLRSGSSKPNTHPRTRNRNRDPRRLSAAPRAIRWIVCSVRASRDGRFLAVASDDSKEANISIFPLNGTSALRRLTFAGHSRFPVWSPDGARVVYQSDRDGDAAIFVQRADETGTADRLTRPAKDEAHIPESWSPDGRTLLFTVRQGQTYSVWTLSLPDRHVQSFGDIRSGAPIDPVFSPDGRWVAYRLTAGISPEWVAVGGVNVQPFPPTGARYEAPRVIANFIRCGLPTVTFSRMFRAQHRASSPLCV
jgi:Tol biopolymer transport system component